MKSITPNKGSLVPHRIVIPPQRLADLLVKHFTPTVYKILEREANEREAMARKANESTG